MTAAGAQDATRATPACAGRTSSPAWRADRRRLAAPRRRAAAPARAARRGAARSRPERPQRQPLRRLRRRRSHAAGSARPGSRRCAAARPATRRRCASSRIRRLSCTSRAAPAGDDAGRGPHGGRRRRRPPRVGVRARGRPQPGPGSVGGGGGRRLGMALGADAAAHHGALDGPGETSRCSPPAPTCPTRPASGGCYGDIVRRGVVVSELPPGFRAPPLVLRRTQPADRRAGRRHGRGRGDGAIGLADHGRLRGGSRADGRRGARAGHRAAIGGDEPPAGRRGHGRSRRRTTCSASCPGRARRPGRPSSRSREPVVDLGAELAALLEGGRGGRRDGRASCRWATAIRGRCCAG